MCGTAVPSPPTGDPTPAPQPARAPEPAPAPAVPDTVDFELQERQSPAVLVMTAVFFLLLFVLGGLILRFQAPAAIVEFIPTPSPVPPTPSYTPTPSGTPTETAAPTLTPTITLTPAPTLTPPPPRIHVVASGETLIGLSLIYRVSPQSIAEANGIDVNTPVQVNQNLAVPWPTPTPPLEILALDVNGETVVLDPRDCERYEVQEGDSLVGIAARVGINFEWLAEVNRIADPSLLQPGDEVCIPEVSYGGTALIPPTVGPSPTPAPTQPPPGPTLLYPADGSTITPPDSVVTLQWVAVQDLADNEAYMVELSNVDARDSLPFRGFTRDTAFRIPSSWRPVTPEVQQLRWRVSIVRITGERSDGIPIYTFRGAMSAPFTLFWLGAPPTPTPTPTATAVPTQTPTRDS